ncbi:MAG TPA: hypothetical protein VJ385_05465 [Fibrobacteria bacterium]|nr:hypothetical protein [Fibrobacteria bacterium]
MKICLLLFSLFFLFACAPNPYRPLSSGLGYTEAKVSKNQYEIMFHGSSRQDPLVARQYAIVRAAEIARREHYPYFRIDNAKTREREEIRTYVDRDPYYGYGYGYGWGNCYGSTRIETKPVVRINVIMDSTACFNCLSADEELKEAKASGILVEVPSG